jgi:predicted nucleotidyltransferase
VRLAFIHGSYVSLFSKSEGAWTAESDVDLLVVGDVDPRAVSRLAREVGAKTSREVNYAVLTARNLRDKIARRDSFIAEVLSKPIIPVAGFPRSGHAAAIRRKPADLLRLLEQPE